MQTLAGVADQGCQPLFDVEVYVLCIQRPLETAALDFALDLPHAAFDVSQVGRADDVLPTQHMRMRQRAGNILTPHALVKIYRGGIAFDQIGDGFGKTAGPCGIRLGASGIGHENSLVGKNNCLKIKQSWRLADALRRGRQYRRIPDSPCLSAHLQSNDVRVD